jgi:hypothetical protein
MATIIKASDLDKSPQHNVIFPVYPFFSIPPSDDPVLDCAALSFDLFSAKDSIVHALQQLLSTDYSQFLLQIKHNQSLHSFLADYLHHSGEIIKLFHSVNEADLGDNSDALIYRKVFLVFYRLIDRSQGKFDSEAVEQEYFRSVAPVINDDSLSNLVILYSKSSNRALLAEVIKYLLTIQPSLVDSLKSKLNNLNSQLNSLSKYIAEQNEKISAENTKLIIANLQPIIQYLVELVVNYPDAAAWLKELELLSSMCVLYDISIPILIDRNPSIKASARPIQRNLLKLANIIMQNCYLKQLNDRNLTTETADSLADDIYSLFMQLGTASEQFSNKQPHRKYTKSVNFNKYFGDLSFVYDFPGYLSNFRSQLQQNQANSVGVALGAERVHYIAQLIRANNSTESLAAERQPIKTKKTSQNNAHFGGGTGKKRLAEVKSADFDEIAKEIIELFGSMSLDFAAACLKEYNNDKEAAVDAIISSKLPSYLQTVSDRAHWRAEDLQVSAPQRTSSEGLLDDLSNPVENDGNFDAAFNEYLARTGRVAKSESCDGSSEKKEDLWERNEEDRQAALFSMQKYSWEDEYDDSYSDFIHFNPDQAAEEPDQQDINPIEKWRAQSKAQEGKLFEEKGLEIHKIAPSRRTAEQQAIYENWVKHKPELLKQQQQVQQREKQQQQQQRQNREEKSHRVAAAAAPEKPAASAAAAAAKPENNNPSSNINVSTPTETVNLQQQFFSSGFRGRGRGRGRGASHSNNNRQSAEETERNRQKRAEGAEQNRAAQAVQRSTMLTGPEINPEPISRQQQQELKQQRRQQEAAAAAQRNSNNNSAAQSESAYSAAGSSSSQQSYSHKTANKSYTGNHNRKNLAQRKFDRAGPKP